MRNLFLSTPEMNLPRGPVPTIWELISERDGPRKDLWEEETLQAFRRDTFRIFALAAKYGVYPGETTRENSYKYRSAIAEIDRHGPDHQSGMGDVFTYSDICPFADTVEDDEASLAIYAMLSGCDPATIPALAEGRVHYHGDWEPEEEYYAQDDMEVSNG